MQPWEGQEAVFETAIVWFRRDLRVDDNPALCAALRCSRKVVPMFLWAPEEEGQFQPGRTNRWWTKHTVVDLERQLEALGTRLVLRTAADRCKGVLQAVADTGAQAVFFNNLYDPITLVSDHEIKQALAQRGVECNSFNADLLYEPWEVVDKENQPFTTFEEFWNGVTMKSYPPPMPLPAPMSMAAVDPEISSESIDSIPWFMTKEQEAASHQLRFRWMPGVAGALTKLETFFDSKLPVFDHERAKVDRESTSELSPWVHIGSISIRYVFYRTKQFEMQAAAVGLDKRQSCADFLRQMGYREYARYLAFFFPFIHERSLLSHLRHCPWRLDQAAFKAWRQGQTGYPLVDAAMKQLWSTGWAHNRLRVVAASFLVKNLLLPWQWGLKHFWDAQLDADLESDALGWQYVAGGMADAHPFSYLIDLSAECKRLDPDGEYVRRWLPALSLLPNEYIHAPWTAPNEVLEAADVELGVNYPRPIISIHQSILSLQSAVEQLDMASGAISSERTGMRHPCRQAYNPLPPATDVPSASVFAAPSIGAVAQSLSSPAGSSAFPDTGMSGPSGSGRVGMPGSSHETSQHRPKLCFKGLSGSEGSAPSSRSGEVAAVKVLPNTCPPAGFDYPKYRLSHSCHQGHYIDVRLVPAEAVKAAVAAARAAGALGRIPELMPIPGLRDEAAHIAAMVHQMKDTASEMRGGADAAAGAMHFSRPGVDEHGQPLSSDLSGEEEAMSEEVVSNTVGLFMPQASGASGMRAAPVKSAAAGAPKRPHPDNREATALDADIESRHMPALRQSDRHQDVCAKRARNWEDGIEVTGDAKPPLLVAEVDSEWVRVQRPAKHAVGRDADEAMGDSAPVHHN